MAKKGRQQNEKHFLNDLTRYSSKELLTDEDHLDEFDEKYAKYEEESAIEKVSSNIRKKLRKGEF